MPSNFEDGWFLNEDTNEEFNIQYSDDRLFITRYVYDKAVSKLVINITDLTSEQILDKISQQGEGYDFLEQI